MDLLGSILNTMEAPPAADEKTKKAIKKQFEEYNRMKDHHQKEMKRFRDYAEERLERLCREPKRESMEFQPLQKVYRAIVHDIAELAGLKAISFGEEDRERYMVVYKSEHPPSADELAARHAGLPWNEANATEYRLDLERKRQLEKDKDKLSEVVQPTSNYKDKYVHLIGRDSALQAARKTVSNTSYGFVPSENKKDVRSIEQTMADIQAKKRLKTSHGVPAEVADIESAVQPAVQPAVEPVVQPAVEPVVQPAVQPAEQHAVEPVVHPAVELAVASAVAPVGGVPTRWAAVEPTVRPAGAPIMVPIGPGVGVEPVAIGLSSRDGYMQLVVDFDVDIPRESLHEAIGLADLDANVANDVANEVEI